MAEGERVMSDYDDLVSRLREWRAGTRYITDESGRETGETVDEPKRFEVMQQEREEAAAAIATLQAEVERLRATLRWVMGEMLDRETGIRDHIPEHFCDFIHAPDIGACTFHERWVSAAEVCGLLDEWADDEDTAQPTEGQERE